MGDDYYDDDVDFDSLYQDLSSKGKIGTTLKQASKSGSIVDELRAEIIRLRQQVEIERTKKLDEVRDEIYEETLEEMEAYARSEIYAETRNSVYMDIRIQEGDKIQEEVRAKYLAELREEIRNEVMTSFKSASQLV